MNQINLTHLVKGGVVAAALMAGGSAWAQAGADQLEYRILDVNPANYLELSGQGGAGAGDWYSGNPPMKLIFAVDPGQLHDGVFGSFELDLRTIAGSGTPSSTATVYPLGIKVGQNGNPADQPVLLAVSTGELVAQGVGDVGQMHVEISLNCGADLVNCRDEHGALENEITGVLHLDHESGKSLRLPGNIQVKFRLTEPEACLSFDNFNTDMTLTENVDHTSVVVIRNGRNAGRVNATTPHGQISNNTLVSNVCAEPETFDLLLVLDGSFRTNPHDNPGNAVFTYRSENAGGGEFDFELFGDATPHGQLLCLQNIELEAGSSILATVHMSINRGMHQSELTGFGVDQAFLFGAELGEAGSGCAGASIAEAESVIEYDIK